MPIMARLYQGAMPGGIVCMPGFEWYGRRFFLMPAHTSSDHGMNQGAEYLRVFTNPKKTGV